MQLQVALRFRAASVFFSSEVCCGVVLNAIFGG
jgi:hypothetical protein